MSAPDPGGPDGAIRVLVVDDQPLIRRGLALTLACEPGIEVVGQAADGRQAIDLATALQPEIVLMDLKMPVLGGVAATRAITGLLPMTRVVVLTTYDTDELVYDAIRAGAQAYLLKDAEESELIETLRAVVSGESRLQPQLARRVIEDLGAPSADRPAGIGEPELPAGEAPLGPRERELLTLIAQGLSNKAIAREMALAEGTVKNYTSRIMNKLHARSRTELAVKALQPGRRA